MSSLITQGLGSPVDPPFSLIDSLILAKIDLANIDGSPLVDYRISFYNDYVPPLVVEDVGVVGKSVEAVTDSYGHAEISLIKGATVTVAILNTSIARQIQVPTTGNEFNLMLAISTADDGFQIHIPDIPAAVRRS